MVDQKKVQEAIKLLLEGIGEDTDREGLKETPERIGRMYEEICGGMDQDAGEHLSKVFSVEIMRWYWRRILPSILCASII